MTTLVCFAVREEARSFRRTNQVRVLLTGMGPAAARVAFLRALDRERPDRVFTCGFAGGLNPGLSAGTVLYETGDADLADRLRRAGAIPGRIHCAPRVAVTRDEKAILRRDLGADAVEMESGVIRRLCDEQGIRSATVRVISDTADEDLPLDFNELITPDGRLRLGGVIARVLLRPSRIGALLKLQRQTAAAARALARCLEPVALGGE